MLVKEDISLSRNILFLELLDTQEISELSAHSWEMLSSNE
jgi:hypothetical protein